MIRVAVEHLPKPTARAKKTLWLWWSGPGTPDLEVCWRAYIHRFDIEHTLRFVKHTLGWTTPRVRLPEQADRWTWLVVAAYTQLRLARGLVADCRLPWEPPRDPEPAHPDASPPGFPPPGAHPWHPGQTAETHQSGSRPSQGQPPRACARYPAIKKAA